MPEEIDYVEMFLAKFLYHKILLNLAIFFPNLLIVISDLQSFME